MDQTALPKMQEFAGYRYNADLAGDGPFYIDGHATLPAIWAARCDQMGDAVAHREKDLGIWRSFSWNTFYDQSRLLGLGLRALGMARGDVVSILSEDNKEWIYLDLAVQAMGGITNGIYPTDSAKQVAFILNDSESIVLVVENDEQLDKFLSIEDPLPHLKKVVVLDSDGLLEFSDPRVMFLDDLFALGREALTATAGAFETEIQKSKPQDTAMLVYTSGTTGNPKGVEISQENLIFTVCASARANPTLPGDEQLCFLPLCHIYERITSVLQPIVARSVVNFAESPDTVFDNLQEVSPTVFIGVPRVYEKIFSRVSIMIGDATPLARACYERAVKVGLRMAEAEYNGETAGALTRIEYAAWDLVMLRNLRRMLGMDRLRKANSGAAPISPDLLKWFRAVGVRIYEGFGMSETTAAASVNSAGNEKLGTVGQVLAGCEMRIGAGDELQFRGRTTFKGYWKNPSATAEATTEDGWFRTGDCARIDNQGFVTITGRLKDIIITAGGKNVAPSEIENRLKFSPYISDAVVIGDARKYLSCLVMIDQENVEKFAQDRRIPFSDFVSLCRAEEVRELIGGVVAEVNKDFARVEQIKDFRLIDILLTAEDDELTATMKLKRGFVETKYAELIAEMY